MEKRCLDCLKEELSSQIDGFQELKRDFRNYAKLFRKTQNRLGGPGATLRAEQVDLITYLEESELRPRSVRLFYALKEVRYLEDLVKKQDPLFNSTIPREDFERFEISSLDLYYPA